MSEDDGEPSDECEDEGGGPCAFKADPPFSSVASVGIVVCVGRLVIMRLAPGQPLEADQRCEKQTESVSRLAARLSSFSCDDQVIPPSQGSQGWAVVDPADWRFKQSGTVQCVQ